MQIGEGFLSLKKPYVFERSLAHFLFLDVGLAIRSVSILLILVSGTIALSAQVPPMISKFHHLTVERGLSDNYNAFISRDSFGFTWLSSTDGLNRFDGKSIKVYGRDELGHNVVTSYCFQDSVGDLWFTSYHAINHYIRAEDRFEPIYLSNNGTPVKEDYYAFHLSRSGELWIRLGTGEHGQVYHYNIYTGEQQSHPRLKTPGLRIKTSGEGDEGWKFAISTYLPGIAGVDLMYRQNDQDFDPIRTAPTDQEGNELRTYNAWIESDSSIWVGTQKGVAQLIYHKGQVTWSQRFNAVYGDEIGLVRDVVGYGDNLLILATKEHGLVFLDKTSGEVLTRYLADSTRTSSLLSSELRELMLDNEANLWISAYEYGVDYCNLKKAKFSSRLSQSVSSILPMGDQMYLSVGKGKVHRLGEGHQLLTTLQFPYPTAKATPRPIMLFPDITGKFWAASGKHLALFNEAKGTWEQTLTFESSIKSLVKLKNGRCLLSTEEAYYDIKIRDQTITATFATDLEAYYGSPATLMFEGMDSKLYLAKNASNLLVLESQSNKLQLWKEIEDVGYIFGAVEIPGVEGIWMSGSFGLAKLVGDSLHIQGPEGDTYRLQSFYGILHYQDKIWLSSNIGLYTFDIKTKEYRNYREADGLQGQTFSQTAYAKATNGTFYFGGENGLNYFDPEKVRDIGTAPKVQLLEFWVQDRPYSKADSSEIYAGDLIDLKPKDNTFKFVFVGMEYSDPAYITYRVKLEGVDPEWVERGTLNEIRYPRVAPGTHTFRVIARNPDGVESEPFALKIKVRPFYYQTTWFKVSVFLLLVLGAFLIYQDQLRRRLSKAKVKNLEELNEYKSRFFTNITHEFRSPLNIILSYLDTALEKRVDLKTGNLEMMQRSGRQLLGLVNQILDLRRLEVAKIQVQYEEMDVLKLTTIVVEDFQKLAYGKGIKLICESQVTDTIMASDREKLRKILSNLISNAIKFTARGGEVKVILQEEQAEMQFQVVDTGIGIPKDKLPHIFGRFYQAHDENTNKFGSGVGLALSQELAQAMGGEIRVVSKEGEGSTFTLILPKVDITAAEDSEDFEEMTNEHGNPIQLNLETVHPEQDTNALAAALHQEALEDREGNALILIVEDNANFRQFIQETLSPHFRTVIRTNGEDGLATAKKLVPDLVVTDVKMPIMDGYELTSELKSNAATCHIPIILLTGLEDIDARVKGIQKGADIYLNKPFHEQELISWIQNLLRLRGKLQDFYRGFGLSGSDKLEEQVEPNDPDRKFIRKATLFIDKNYHKESFSVTELSKMMEMEYVTFYRKFRAITNENAKKSIQDKRIARAKYLLLNEPSKRIRQIAFEVGFSDPGYFSKVFRESEGTTPKKFRH